MRTKSLCLSLTLIVMLTTAAIGAPRTTSRQPKNIDGPSDATVIERVIRVVKKIAHTFDQISVPPAAPVTTT